MGFFDDVLAKKITDDGDRNTFLELGKKYGDIQSDFDGAMSAALKWQDWREKAWDDTANKTREQIRAEQELNAARDRIVALETSGGFGTEMTFDDIKARLTEGGYVTKADLLKEIDTPVTGKVNQSAANIEAFFRKTATLPVEHFVEFGKIEPDFMDKFLDRYSKAPTSDPRAVYNEMVLPQREERRLAQEKEREAKWEAEKAQIAKDTEERVRREVGMAPGTPGMPIDQGSGQGVGPVQRQQLERFNAIEKDQKLSDAPLGSGINAREGLKWLHDQRAAGGVQ